MTTWIVAFDGGETYDVVGGAVTLPLPRELDDELEVNEWVKENYDEGEPVVPLSEVLESVELSLQGLGLSHVYDYVVATVEDCVVNNWGID